MSGKARVNYWFTIAFGVFLIWRYWVDGEQIIFLFAATWCIIHAHGNRILDYLKEQQ